MAVVALLNSFVSINAVNLSDHVRQATLAMEATNLDSTAMGDLWVEATGGLKSGTLTIEFLDDFALASIDATLWPLFGGTVPFEVRIDAGVVSTTNPKYTGSVFIAQHSLGGSLNEMAGKSLTLPTSGVVLRATA